MAAIKHHVLEMIDLVSDEERRRNPKADEIIRRIERLLLWLNETMPPEIRCEHLQRRKVNGQ